MPGKDVVPQPGSAPSRPKNVPEPTRDKEGNILSRKPTLKVNNSPSNKPTPILKSDSRLSVPTIDPVLSPGLQPSKPSAGPDKTPSIMHADVVSPASGPPAVESLATELKTVSVSSNVDPTRVSSIASANNSTVNFSNLQNAHEKTLSSGVSTMGPSSANLFDDEKCLLNTNVDPTSLLKRTSSLSFTEPSEIAKSRRGSISAHPSNISLANANTNRHHPQNQLNQQRNPTLARNSSNSKSITDPSVLKNANLNMNSDALHFTPKRAFPASPRDVLENSKKENRLDSDIPSIAPSEKSDRSLQNSRNNSAEIRSLTSTMTEADANMIRKSLSMKKPPKTVVQAEEIPKYPFTQYFQKTDDNKVHILLGASGSVATIKIPELIDKIYNTFTREKVSIQLVLTKCAEHFLKGFKISSDIKIWRDQDEWFGYNNNDPILHIELRKWADIFVVAPVSANTLAKISNGIADNLLTSIFRAWNPTNPIIVAPAMNTFMYTHPVTKIQLEVIKEHFNWIHVLKPVEKILVCGDIGMGGMTTVHEIAVSAKKELAAHKKKKQLELKKEQENRDLQLDEEDGQGTTGSHNEDDEDEDEDDEEEEEEDDDDNDNDSDESNGSDEEDDDEEDEEDEEDEDEGSSVLQRINTRTKMQKASVITDIPEELEAEADIEDEDYDESHFHDAKDDGDHQPHK